MLAPFLRVVGNGAGAGAGVFVLRLGDELVKHLGPAARSLDVFAGLEREFGLQAVVDSVVERTLRDHSLLHAGDVGRGDVEQVRTVAGGQDALVEVERAKEVGLESLVDRRVEADGGGGVDGDVEVAGDLRDAAAEVAVDHLHVRVEMVQETLLPMALAQDGEGGFAHEVLHTLHAGRTRLAPDQQHDVRVGEVQQ